MHSSLYQKKAPSLRAHAHTRKVYTHTKAYTQLHTLFADRSIHKDTWNFYISQTISIPMYRTSDYSEFDIRVWRTKLWSINRLPGPTGLALLSAIMDWKVTINSCEYFTREHRWPFGRSKPRDKVSLRSLESISRWTSDQGTEFCRISRGVWLNRVRRLRNFTFFSKHLAEVLPASTRDDFRDFRSRED